MLPNEKGKSPDETKVMTAELSRDEIEERKKQFLKTMKIQNVWTKAISIVAVLIVLSYFIVVYFYHSYFDSQVLDFHNNIPTFLNRYRYLIL